VSLRNIRAQRQKKSGQEMTTSRRLIPILVRAHWREVRQTLGGRESPRVGHARRDWDCKSVQEVSKQAFQFCDNSADLLGAGSRIRTDDLLITNPARNREFAIIS
jgi:hypothetical protein